MSDTTKVAELVNELFRTHLNSDGEEYSNVEVAKFIQCDNSYLAKLRSGKITNPGRLILGRLCRFFNVSPVYFFPELADMTEEVSPDQQLQTALRSIGLDKESQSYIEGIISVIRRKKKDQDS